MSKTIGMALKENRLALGYSKKQMAQGIMSANNYARIESDEQYNKEAATKKLAEKHAAVVSD